MNDDRTYLDAGYNKFLTKQDPPIDTETEDTTSLNTEYKSLPVAEGITKSPDGRLEVDWNTNTVTHGDGARDRIKTGYDDDSNTYRIILTAADLLFKTSGGLQYGSCYGNEIGWTQASAVQNTWYEISDSDMADGQLNGVTHDGSGKLTVSKAGRYLCNWTGSFEANGANVHVQITFSVSGTETSDGMNHIETLGANNQHPSSGNAILNLAANDTVEVSIRTTDAGTPNLSTDHLNITMVQIGG